ncbi:hypothetical protein, partial [Ruegeria lacuscaerulensis]|uniref:hypothetical protein n=1 Tax=Ruegeria lacuscaerulensis TaxID=55218 RepID=UPI001BE3EE10
MTFRLLVQQKSGLTGRTAATTTIIQRQVWAVMTMANDGLLRSLTLGAMGSILHSGLMSLKNSSLIERQAADSIL